MIMGPARRAALGAARRTDARLVISAGLTLAERETWPRVAASEVEERRKQGVPGDGHNDMYSAGNHILEHACHCRRWQQNTDERLQKRVPTVVEPGEEGEKEKAGDCAK